jgi:hypothetical protein
MTGSCPGSESHQPARWPLDAGDPGRGRHREAVATKACTTFDDYDDVQRALFEHLYLCETHRFECRRYAKRLADGRARPADLLFLADGVDPHDARVHARSKTFAFAVGDAVALRLSRYDRTAPGLVTAPPLERMEPCQSRRAGGARRIRRR